MWHSLVAPQGRKPTGLEGFGVIGDIQKIMEHLVAHEPEPERVRRVGRCEVDGVGAGPEGRDRNGACALARRGIVDRRPGVGVPGDAQRGRGAGEGSERLSSPTSRAAQVKKRAVDA